MHDNSKRTAGIVLPLVLIIGLLLSAGIFTFLNRSIVDGILVSNRDNEAAAMALARGGIQLGTAVVYRQRHRAQVLAMSSRDAGSTLDDFWARVGSSSLETDWGGKLVVEIEDTGARLNINALVPQGVAPQGEEVSQESQANQEAEEFLVEILRKVIGEMRPSTEREFTYDERELSRNLIDYIDADDIAINGRNEDDYYLSQIPPYSPANGPLMSIDELAMIEGFDVELTNALRPYLTVYPLLGDQGINVNTAPSHVLALLYFGSSGDMNLAKEDVVTDVMKVREAGRFVCTQTESDPKKCVPLSEVGLAEGGIYPPVTLPQTSLTFKITARAEVNQVTRIIEAVIDTTNRETPQLLSWRSN